MKGNFAFDGLKFAGRYRLLLLAEALLLIWLSVQAVFPIVLHAVGPSDEAIAAGIADERVILAHGLGRNERAMWLLEFRLRRAGFDVCTIDYRTLATPLESALNQAGSDIKSCIPEAGKVHFVEHSMGGLVIRHYLNLDTSLSDYKRLGEVVMLGTPNHGSELADLAHDYFPEVWQGNVVVSLNTRGTGLAGQLPSPYYPTAVIAGTKPSVFTGFSFPGSNDGLVSTDSARLPKMKDFLIVDVGHSMLRYDAEVAGQVIHVLRTGTFESP